MQKAPGFHVRRASTTVVNSVARQRRHPTASFIPVEITGAPAPSPPPHPSRISNATAAMRRFTTCLESVAAIPAGRLTLEEVATRIFAAVAVALPGARSLVFLRDEAGVIRLLAPRERGTARFDSAKVFEEERSRPAFIFDRCALTDPVKTGSPVFYRSEAELLADYPEHRNEVERAGTRALACVPTFVPDDGSDDLIQSAPNGAVAVVFSEPHMFRPVERRFLADLGRVVGPALEHSYLRELLAAARTEVASAHREREEERRRQEEEQRARLASERALGNALLRLTFHVTNSPLAVLETDGSGRITYWSPGAERMFGWPAEEGTAFSTGILDFVHEEDADRVRMAWTEMEEGAARSVCQNRNITRDGRVLHCVWHNSALRDSAGRLVSVLSLGMDVTAQRRAETALRESEALHRKLMETAQEGIWLLDEEARVTYANGHLADMLGYTTQEMKGRAMTDFLVSDCLTPATDVRLRRSDGTERWALATITPIMEGERCTGFMGMFTDITERRLLGEWQRGFVRDVLVSVTQGRLLLCGDPDDLPHPLEPFSFRRTIALQRETLSTFRAILDQVATDAGLGNERRGDLLLGAGEAAMNAVVHAGGGVAHMLRDPERGLVQVWLRDRGGGIALEHLHRATLEPGFTTAGTLGHGFYILLQTCDRVYLHTGPAGTTVVLEQYRTAPNPV